MVLVEVRFATIEQVQGTLTLVGCFVELLETIIISSTSLVHLNRIYIENLALRYLNKL